MWIYSVTGFVSVVQDRDDLDTLVVRGRLKADVDAFCARACDLYDQCELDAPRPTVQHTPKADYHYRVRIPREVFGLMLQVLVREIDYGNFKSAVGERQGHARKSVYHRVWSETVLLAEECQPLSASAQRRKP